MTGLAAAPLNDTDKKGSQRELAPENPTTITTKEVKIMNPTIAPAADGESMNARTASRLTFQPVPGVAQNTRGASIPAGTPVHYDGTRLLASVDGPRDYELTAPEQGDYELDTPNPYATEANPELQRHHWQNLAGIVASFRPDWAIDRILENLWGSRNKQTFPELAHIALAVAMNPKYKTPGAIGLAAAAVIEL